LLAEAEKAIDKVLAARPAANKITLRDIERLAVQAGTDLSAEIQQALGDEGSEGHNSGEELCPKCGSRMQRRGQQGRRVVTDAGSGEWERVYCVCASCGYSFFPLRRSLGVG
jgi:DNA-directed RNA polymerase subunit M/transcription elongation factor TFIIS